MYRGIYVSILILFDMCSGILIVNLNNYVFEIMIK